MKLTRYVFWEGECWDQDDGEFVKVDDVVAWAKENRVAARSEYQFALDDLLEVLGEKEEPK